MLQSVITRKGQTTIPKEIRKLLNLKPNDKLFYIVEENKVILKPIHGNILELRGSITSKEPKVDFDKIRAITRKKISKKIVEGN
jgi:antitoxin PrlF